MCVCIGNITVILPYTDVHSYTAISARTLHDVY